MAPENPSSIDYMRQLGAIPKPGSESNLAQKSTPDSDSSNRLQASANVDTPFKTVNLPEPIPGTAFGSQREKWQEQIAAGNIPESVLAVTNPVDVLDDENEDDRRRREQAESELANRGSGRAEYVNDEALSSADRPFKIFKALRRIERKLDDPRIPHSLSESYKPPGQLGIMYARQEVLSVPIDELIDDGLVTETRNGKIIPLDKTGSAYAISTKELINTEDDGTIKYNILGQPAYRTEYNFGTDAQRAELSRAYERAVLEMEARSIIGEWTGVVMNLRFRDDLNGLVNFEHETGAKLKTDHLTALFNMPDVNEMKKNPEDHTLGDQVEEALFLNLLMLNSGTKQQMQEFLERPGAQHLIIKMAKEEEARRGVPYTTAQWINEFIGDVDAWENDTNRYITDDKDTEGNDVRATFWEEAADGRRGRITKWGNIAAFGGNPGDFGHDDEISFIEKDIGGASGSPEAAWVAGSLCRAFGVYASEGYVALPNGKSHLPLGEGRFISGDDRGKMYAYMFNYKEGTRGRPSGLKDMIGRIPDMAFNLFDWTQVAVSDLPPKTDKEGNVLIGTDGKPLPQRRSMWDAWLGTPAGKPIRDILTGEQVGSTKKEDYHRLGNLEFDSLDADFHGTFGIMQWLIGRDGDGVFSDALNTEVKLDDFKIHALKKKIKYIGIVMNDVILAKGSTHLYDMSNAKQLKRNFFRNMQTARIDSYSFLTNVFGQTIPIFDPDISEYGIPAPVLVKLFVEEALQPNPRTEDEIKKHYIDSYAIVTQGAEAKILGITIKHSGNSKDRIAVLNEPFIDESNPKDVEFADYVGKVRGRQTYLDN